MKRKDFNDGARQIEHDFANNVPLEDIIGVAPEVNKLLIKLIGIRRHKGLSHSDIYLLMVLFTMSGALWALSSKTNTILTDYLRKSLATHDGHQMLIHI